ISSFVVKLASPGVPPKQAQAPKARTSWDFSLNNFATSSCSEFLTCPLTTLNTISPFFILLTLSYLKSSATGQITISPAPATLRSNSFMSTTASSQPPHDPNQQIATFGFAILFSPSSFNCLFWHLLCHC